MRIISFCKADGAEQISLNFCRELKKFETLSELENEFQLEASAITDALLAHLPQGVTDRILADLCRRKAVLHTTPLVNKFR